MRRLLIISGAGISAESGIRTFRTDTDSGKALWDDYDLEQVCNIHAFNGNFYHKTHAFYNKRREELGTVEPNLAHLRVAEWYKRYRHQVLNITTNVDDLMERAGVHPLDIVHVHGYLPEIVVTDSCGVKTIHDIGYGIVEPDFYHHVKPNVVFFGEVAPKYSEMYEILDNLTSQDMVIVVGCSNQVINFNWELFPAVNNKGTKVVIINPQVPYHEEQIYEEKGVKVFRTGAVDAFSNPALIKYVEDHLEGKVNVE